jgi:hypothetical protein
MYLDSLDFSYVGLCLEAFFYGTIPILRPVMPLISIPGIYSAIFFMYLRYHVQRGSDRAKNVLFIAICVLYVLSFAIIILDMTSVGISLVSNDDLLQVCAN